MKRIVERFVDYVKIDTTSVDGLDVVPSSDSQFVLANKLADELKALGVSNVKVDEHACVTGKLPSNLPEGKTAPAIGFLAHLDTSPDAPGKDVKPQFHENYDGGKLVINEELGFELNPEDLKAYIGNTIITSDGTTLLGADNKAGIAIIMEAVEYFVANPEVPHGDFCIAFTPDEEVQGGAALFDIEGFGADFAFTVDGEDVGEFNHETFNAAGATVTIKGVCIHPGSAKDKLVNPLILATEYLSELPRSEAPETTEGRDGFYYPYEIQGNEQVATIEFLLRDFDRDSMEKRKVLLQEIAKKINDKWGSEYVTVEIEDQYSNMNDFLEGQEHIIENALEAYRECGMEPRVIPVRGGTDGATLSRRGLPCPNIFVGGKNFHGVLEYVSVEGMEKAVEVVVKIIENYAK